MRQAIAGGITIIRLRGIPVTDRLVEIERLKRRHLRLARAGHRRTVVIKGNKGRLVADHRDLDRRTGVVAVTIGHGRDKLQPERALPDRVQEGLLIK